MNVKVECFVTGWEGSKSAALVILAARMRDAITLVHKRVEILDITWEQGSGYLWKGTAIVAYYNS